MAKKCVFASGVVIPDSIPLDPPESLCPRLATNNGGLEFNKMRRLQPRGDPTLTDDFKSNHFEVLQSQLLGLTMVPLTKRLYLDSDRLEVVRYVSWIARCLEVNASSLSTNQFSRVCVGIKGTGKTTFLLALSVALQALLSRTVVIYLDAAKMISHSATFIEAIVKVMRDRFPPEAQKYLFELSQQTPDQFILQLMELRMKLIVLVDKYHAVYTQPMERGSGWVQQISHFGNCGSSRVFILLCGSSAYVRGLIFGKLPLTNEVKQKFPAYQGLANNLNSSRFNVLELSSILNEIEFKKMLQSHGLKVCSQNRCWAIFALTGGRHRFVTDSDFKEFPNRSFYAAHQFCASYKTIFNALSSKLLERKFADASFFDNPWNMVSLFPVSIFADLDIQQLYQAADDGAIVYTHERVGFCTPLIAHFAINFINLKKIDCWFDATWKTCLRFPVGPLGIKATEILRAAIASRVYNGKAWFKKGANCTNESMETEFKRLQMISVEYQGAAIPLVVNSVSAVAVKSLTQENMTTVSVLDEICNRGGTNIVIVDPLKSEISRCHVEIGISVLGLKAAKIISKKLCRRGKIGPKLFTVRLYLITTRYCTPKAIEELVRANVSLISRDKLIEWGIWPEAVVSWAQNESLYQFCDSVIPPINPVNDNDADECDEDESDQDESDVEVEDEEEHDNKRVKF